MDSRQAFEAMQKSGHLFTQLTPTLAAVYAEFFQSRGGLEAFKAGLKQAMIEGKTNPSAQWLAEAASGPSLNQAAYRAFNPQTEAQKLLAGKAAEVDPESARFARIAVMAGIYSHQGDTKFYRAMLAGNGSTWSAILAQAAGGFPVTHEDVLLYLGIESAPRGRNFDQEGGSTPLPGRVNRLTPSEAPSRAENGPLLEEAPETGSDLARLVRGMIRAGDVDREALSCLSDEEKQGLWAELTPREQDFLRRNCGGS